MTLVVLDTDVSSLTLRHRLPSPAPNDTWIAACCIVYGLPLATLNNKDFEDFAARDGLRLIDG